MSFPNRTPPTVEKQKANSPRPMMSSVLRDKKFSAVAVAPTEMPSKRVTMFMRAFCAVSESLSVTPHSLKRLPSMRQPSSGATEGSKSAVMIVTIMGKMIFAALETFLGGSMRISFSFLVVSIFISGG